MYAASHHKELCDAPKETTMTKRTTLSTIGGLFDMFGSAVSVSRAIESNRRPQASDLKTLGIDPAQFDRVGRL
jgi:hypothetical protein